jgi:hypothetical protein
MPSNTKGEDKHKKNKTYAAARRPEFPSKKKSASAGINIVHVSEGILKAPSEKKIQR